MEEGSLRGGIFFILSASLGATLLTMPLLQKRNGIFLSIACQLLNAIIALVQMNLLFKVAILDQTSLSYAETVKKHLGLKMEKVFQIMVTIYSFGILIAVQVICNLFD